MKDKDIVINAFLNFMGGTLSGFVVAYTTGQEIKNVIWKITGIAILYLFIMLIGGLVVNQFSKSKKNKKLM